MSEPQRRRRGVSPFTSIALVTALVIIVAGVMSGRSDGQWATAGIGVSILGLVLANPPVLDLFGRYNHLVGILAGLVIIGGAAVMIIFSRTTFQLVGGCVLAALGVAQVILHSSPRARASQFGQRILGPA